MSESHAPSRRHFLRSAAACAVAAPYIISARALGAEGALAPSNRINMASIGIGGMGGGHLGGLIGNSDVQVLAVCDVDAKRRKTAKDRVEKAYAEQMKLGAYKGCAEYGDFREVLQRGDIDAVAVAPPDHWHVPVSMAAIKAGKDVYCEKPLTLAIAEGRILSNAVRQYGRILQVGSQQRSSARFRFACELVRNGRLGQIKTIEVGLPGQNAQNLGPQAPMPVPPELDYNMWLGPAPFEPYHEKRVHYLFRFFLDYSGGQPTNFGAHDIDIAQWGLGMDDSGPVEVEGKGEFPRNAFYTTATKVFFVCTYASGVKLTVETKGSKVRFVGTDGWVEIDRGKIDANPKSLLTTVIGPSEIHLYDSRNHWGNFLECVRSRRQPIATAEIGHRSVTVCHLGNIAMLTGRKLKWDPARERFVNDADADRMLSRPMRAPWYL